MNFPIIRLEVEGMKHAICAAMTQYQAQMDEYVKTAVEEYCTPENLLAVISKNAKSVLDSVLRDEVERFFKYGDGRKAVAMAVIQSLSPREASDEPA
ncbi:hypothetical protein [Luteibacter sp. SG786]|uniref:hypothetical protein n=1 Tax=Luteibacter sp. SG786 TaxID=2587130 RepID=UPI00141FF0DB|nr:hypothetical protein [Luteibacter sp. SG786]NII54364.1 hypothetical protein [Luteibacter sp. SG786]